MKNLGIVSVSGGIDSATVACEVLEKGYDLVIVNFEYNQKHKVELVAFDRIHKWLEEKYNTKIPVHKINLVPLLNSFIGIWEDLRDSKEITNYTDHQYYTPSRNLLFSVISSVIGEIIGFSKQYDKIYVGLGIHTHSKEAYGEHKDYWDITPAFYEALNNVFKLNDVKDVRLFAPFVDKTKGELIKRALELQIPYHKTWTCYNPNTIESNDKVIYTPCNECEACKERELAGKNIGVADINDYEVVIEK